MQGPERTPTIILTELAQKGFAFSQSVASGKIVLKKDVDVAALTAAFPKATIDDKASCTALYSKLTNNPDAHCKYVRESYDLVKEYIVAKSLTGQSAAIVQAQLAQDLAPITERVFAVPMKNTRNDCMCSQNYNIASSACFGYFTVAMAVVARSGWIPGVGWGAAIASIAAAVGYSVVCQNGALDSLVSCYATPGC